MAQLPSHALERVFAFAVGEPGTYPSYEELDGHRRPMIDTLACVCRDWSALANEIRARHRLSEFRLESITPTRKHVLRVRRELTLRRAYLKSLHIYLHDDALCDRSKEANAKAKWQALGWDALLSLVPRLECLAVEDCVVAEFSTPEIIAAAAAHCRSLQKLVVPISDHTFSSNDARAQMVAAEIPRILNATIEGIEAWHLKGTHGGLRELFLPLCTTSGRIPQSLVRLLIETIVRCCPQLEVLHKMISWATESDEHWFIDASLWDAFCSRCSQLTQFSWHSVPFTTQFFAIFGTYPKPKLTKLTLAGERQVELDRVPRHRRSSTAVCE
ncbi:hypothetical protein PINS_up023568 [Pythium insidiosum]|nr:hypothetical protein PINS_up023568 [Pythium insidiosum]